MGDTDRKINIKMSNPIPIIVFRISVENTFIRDAPKYAPTNKRIVMVITNFQSTFFIMKMKSMIGQFFTTKRFWKNYPIKRQF